MINRLNFSVEGIFGGTLLGIRSSSFLNLYDWETGVVVRRVDVVPKNVRSILRLHNIAIGSVDAEVVNVRVFSIIVFVKVFC